MNPFLLPILGENLGRICAIERLVIYVWLPKFIGGRFEKFSSRHAQPRSLEGR